MALSRRNTLIGLGALVGGAGILGGTGAFTSVQAERTVSVSTAGDASANLGLTGDEEITGTEDVDGVDVLTVSADDLNERAKTVFEDAITATNNGTEDLEFYVEVEVQNQGDPAPIEFEVDGSSIEGSGNSVSLTTGTPVTVDVVVDLLPDGVTGSDLDNVTGVTFFAEQP